MQKNGTKRWLLVSKMRPRSVSVEYSGVHPLESCCGNEVTENPRESSKQFDRSFHNSIIFLRIFFLNQFWKLYFYIYLGGKKKKKKKSCDRAVCRVWDWESRWNVPWLPQQALRQLRLCPRVPEPPVGAVWATCTFRDLDILDTQQTAESTNSEKAFIVMIGVS